MALIATIASPDANSYVTEAEATLYFAERMHSSKWDAIVDKASSLITASRMLDWNLTFNGTPATDDQSMKFPRVDLIRMDGRSVSSTIIPLEVKYATFELALAFADKDRSADNSLSGIEQVKAGPLFVKATPAGYDSTNISLIPNHIRHILIDFITSSGIGVVRLMRA